MKAGVGWVRLCQPSTNHISWIISNIINNWFFFLTLKTWAAVYFSFPILINDNHHLWSSPKTLLFYFLLCCYYFDCCCLLTSSKMPTFRGITSLWKTSCFPCCPQANRKSSLFSLLSLHLVGIETGVVLLHESFSFLI